MPAYFNFDSIFILANVANVEKWLGQYMSAGGLADSVLETIKAKEAKLRGACLEVASVVEDWRAQVVRETYPAGGPGMPGGELEVGDRVAVHEAEDMGREADPSEAPEKPGDLHPR